MRPPPPAPTQDGFSSSNRLAVRRSLSYLDGTGGTEFEDRDANKQREGGMKIGKIALGLAVVPWVIGGLLCVWRPG